MADSSGPVAAVADGDTLDVGLGPSLAMAMTYVANADSLGIAMGNAVANQQRGQVLAGAALAQVLRMIIAAGS